MKQRVAEAGKETEKETKKEIKQEAQKEAKKKSQKDAQKKTHKETQSRAEMNNGYNWKYFLLEFCVLLFGTAEMYALCRIRGEASDRLLGNCCMALLGLAVIGFQFRREYLHDTLDYNNKEHVVRFWFCVFIGLLAVCACGFLPVGGWPFLAVFLMLALFSNMSTGITAGAMLLMMAVMISGGTVGSFVLYMVSGVFVTALFQHMKSDFKIGIPLFLSVLCLLVCETANIILVANARPDLELFVVPIVNMIVSSILLLGCLRLFFFMVIYQYREKYLELNDTGNPVLVDMKQQNNEEYLHSIHTAHFCERIARKLDLDADALKCAGYYHRMGEGLEEFMGQKKFPPAVKTILTEYAARRKGVTKKETAVLICSETVLGTMLVTLGKEPDGKNDIDHIIDMIFRKFLEDGSFNNCNITVRELRTIQKIFKEEKIYYGFLRRE